MHSQIAPTDESREIFTTTEFVIQTYLEHDSRELGEGWSSGVCLDCFFLVSFYE